MANSQTLFRQILQREKPPYPRFVSSFLVYTPLKLNLKLVSSLSKDRQLKSDETEGRRERRKTSCVVDLPVCRRRALCTHRLYCCHLTGYSSFVYVQLSACQHSGLELLVVAIELRARVSRLRYAVHAIPG